MNHTYVRMRTYQNQIVSGAFWRVLRNIILPVRQFSARLLCTLLLPPRREQVFQATRTEKLVLAGVFGVWNLEFGL